MAGPASTTHFRNLSTTGLNVTNGGAEVVAVLATNSTAATAYTQVFDAAAADVTLGTTVPLFVIHVPGGTSAIEGSFFLTFYPPVLFSTRMSVFGTTTPEGNMAVGAGVFCQVWIN